MMEPNANFSSDLFHDALLHAQEKVRRLLEKYPGFYPMYTFRGRWKHDLPAWTRWCDGFLPGLMWIFQSRRPQGSDDERWWFEKAVEYSERLEPRKADREVHDLGFLFMPSYGRWHKATGDPRLREVLIEAGRTLALRYSSKGRFLRSFLAPDSLFIDIMMNVGLIFYAAREARDPVLQEIATAHCLTTRRVLVRGDGSTAHEGLFDLESGAFLRQSTQQGFRPDSCWSRGLAWAIYGFCEAYEYCGDARFLRTAQGCAEYYAESCPPNGVPPWDFDAPDDSRTLADTSAAAIAAAGLLRLADAASDAGQKRLHQARAWQILGTLCQRYLAGSEPAWEGILKGGVYHRHKGLGVDESVMWGEYFFVEALDSALKGQGR